MYQNTSNRPSLDDYNELTHVDAQPVLKGLINRLEKAVSNHWNNRNELGAIKNTLMSSPEENGVAKEQQSPSDICGLLNKFISEFEDINTQVTRTITDMRKIL